MEHDDPVHEQRKGEAFSEDRRNIQALVEAVFAVIRGGAIATVTATLCFGDTIHIAVVIAVIWIHTPIPNRPTSARQLQCHGGLVDGLIDGLIDGWMDRWMAMSCCWWMNSECFVRNEKYDQ